MGNSTRFLVAVALAGALPVVPGARAEIFQTAEAVKPKGFTVGGFGKVYFDPTGMPVIEQAAFGVMPKLQVEGRVGFGSLASYFGAFGKYELLNTPIAQVSAWSGFHSFLGTYWDVAPIVSRRFGASFQMYLAPLFQLALGGGGSTAFRTSVGAAILLVPALDLYSEIVFGFGDAGNSVGFGVRYAF